ncbi:UNVERIFIED_CONTAM: hypothetical protein FKN15_029942 [Acipenser sinensis]
MDTLYRVHAEELGLTQFPPVEASIAALVQAPNLALLYKDAICPNKQCRVSEALGFMHAAGIGFHQNQARALVYYTFAGLGGDLRAKMILGYRYWSGINMPKNCEAAVIQYRKVAHHVAKKLSSVQHGEVELVRILEMPENYSTKTGIMDLDLYQYYKFLAERGDIQTQALGFMHAAGIGFHQNQARVSIVIDSQTFSTRNIYILTRKSDLQLPMSLWGHKLDLVGFGVPRDLKVASRYFAFASKHGHHLSHYYLAEMYATGKGAQRSCDIAVKLYKEVCKLGSWSEMFLSAYFAYKEGDMDSALVQYLLLGEMGFEEAQSNAAYLLESSYALARIKIGDYHYYGYGTDVDYEAAVIHYRLAAEQQGSAQAMFNLGYMYEQGKGLKKDIHLALRMYDMAVATSSDAHFPVLLATCKLSIVKLFREYQNSRSQRLLSPRILGNI